MIILEEDLDVSPDIFWYFYQLLPVLEEDQSLYCVSAWNDQVICRLFLGGYVTMIAVNLRQICAEVSAKFRWWGAC